MASFLTPFLGSSINVALPAIGRDLGMTTVALSWVASAFILVSAVCLVPFGHLADRVGRRRVFLAGMIVFTATTLGCGFMRSGGALIALRAPMAGLSLLPGLAGVGLVALALAGFALFVAWERRVAHPVLDVTLLATNAVFRALLRGGKSAATAPCLRCVPPPCCSSWPLPSRVPPNRSSTS